MAAEAPADELGHQPEDADLDVAARPVPSVTPDGRVRRQSDVASALAQLARAGVELFGDPDRQLIRWCADARYTRCSSTALAAHTAAGAAWPAPAVGLGHLGGATSTGLGAPAEGTHDG